MPVLPIECVLTLENLHKRYQLPAPLPLWRGGAKPKTKQALAGVSLTLGPGLYGLLGPNGAGKGHTARRKVTLQVGNNFETTPKKCGGTMAG